MDAPILCFKHCGSKIFCSTLPDKCPACRDTISSTALDGIPFKIPYPFVKANQHPCAVVMKSTEGKLLNDYHNSKNLHIAVTNSLGTVTEYDSDGVQNHKTCDWNQSILIYSIPEAWIDHWDFVLEEIRVEERWSCTNYDENDHNCCNFVLEFLRKLGCDELRDFIVDKQTFCEKLVVPKSSLAANYVAMYRMLERFGYFIEKGT